MAWNRTDGPRPLPLVTSHSWFWALYVHNKDVFGEPYGEYVERIGKMTFRAVDSPEDSKEPSETIRNLMKEFASDVYKLETETWINSKDSATIAAVEVLQSPSGDAGVRSGRKVHELFFPFFLLDIFLMNFRITEETVPHVDVTQGVVFPRGSDGQIAKFVSVVGSRIRSTELQCVKSDAYQSIIRSPWYGRLGVEGRFWIQSMDVAGRMSGLKTKSKIQNAKGNILVLAALLRSVLQKRYTPLTMVATAIQLLSEPGIINGIPEEVRNVFEKVRKLKTADAFRTMECALLFTPECLLSRFPLQNLDTSAYSIHEIGMYAAKYRASRAQVVEKAIWQMVFRVADGSDVTEELEAMVARFETDPLFGDTESVVTQAADALRAARNKERNPPVATRDTMDDAARDFEDVQLVEDDDVTMLDHELITIRVPKEAKPSMYSFGLPSIMGQGGSRALLTLGSSVSRDITCDEGSLAQFNVPWLKESATAALPPPLNPFDGRMVSELSIVCPSWIKEACGFERDAIRTSCEADKREWCRLDGLCQRGAEEAGAFAIVRELAHWEKSHRSITGEEIGSRSVVVLRGDEEDAPKSVLVADDDILRDYGMHRTVIVQHHNLRVMRDHDILRRSTISATKTLVKSDSSLRLATEECALSQFPVDSANLRSLSSLEVVWRQLKNDYGRIFNESTPLSKLRCFQYCTRDVYTPMSTGLYGFHTALAVVSGRMVCMLGHPAAWQALQDLACIQKFGAEGLDTGRFHWRRYVLGPGDMMYIHPGNVYATLTLDTSLVTRERFYLPSTSSRSIGIIVHARLCKRSFGVDPLQGMDNKYFSRLMFYTCMREVYDEELDGDYALSFNPRDASSLNRIVCVGCFLSVSSILDPRSYKQSICPKPSSASMPVSERRQLNAGIRAFTTLISSLKGRFKYPNEKLESVCPYDVLLRDPLLTFCAIVLVAIRRRDRRQSEIDQQASGLKPYCLSSSDVQRGMLELLADFDFTDADFAARIQEVDDRPSMYHLEKLLDRSMQVVHAGNRK